MATVAAMTHVIDTLRERGFVADFSDEAGLRDLLDSERVTFYVGFDPTAASLHVGNLVGMMAMAWLQRAGHRPIALAGGATGRIGDPSGRDAEREVMTEDEARQPRRHPPRPDAGARPVGEGDPRANWSTTTTGSGPFGYLEFLRSGRQARLGDQMLARETVRRRLEQEQASATPSSATG